MARVIDYALHSARARRGAKARDPVVTEIAEALAYFGGEAHRRMVLDRLVGQRGGDDGEALRLRIIDAFEAHCDDNLSARDRTGLFRRPFGRDSHRWALNLRAEDMAGIRAAAAAANPPR